MKRVVLAGLGAATFLVLLALSQPVLSQASSEPSAVVSEEARTYGQLQRRYQQRMKAQRLQTVTGWVLTPEKAPIAGAVVSVGKQVTVSDETGFFELEQVPVGAYSVSFTHPDYVTQQRSQHVRAYQDNVLYGYLIPRQPAVQVEVSRGFRLEHEGVTLDFPAYALRRVDTGERVQGRVDLRLTSIDPAKAWIGWATPAPLVGERLDGSLASLRSLRMFNLELAQGAHALELVPGILVYVTMPVPEVGFEEGAQIPMWHHDEHLGTWVEEPDADATVSRDEQGRLMAYTELSHFSTWNLDVPQDTVLAQIKVKAASDTYQYLKLQEVGGATSCNASSYTLTGAAWTMLFPRVGVPVGDTSSGFTHTFYFHMPQSHEDAYSNADAPPFLFSLSACRADGITCEPLPLNSVEMTANSQVGTSAYTLTPVSESSGGPTNSFRSCDVYRFLVASQAHSGESAGSPSFDGSVCGGWLYLGKDESVPFDCTDGKPDFSSDGADNGVNGPYVLSSRNGTEMFQKRSFTDSGSPYYLSLGLSILSSSARDTGYASYVAADAMGQLDADQDGISDAYDNCRYVPNANQANYDKNGFGDVCEPSFCIVPDKDPMWDTDGDTLDDLCDVLPTQYNPSQWFKAAWYRDADGDSFGDVTTKVVAYDRPSSGYVSRAEDCHDGNASIYPGAAEQKNSLDDNCNGIIDDPFKVLIFYNNSNADAVNAIKSRAGGSYYSTSSESTFVSQLNTGSYQLVVVQLSGNTNFAKATTASPAASTFASKVREWVLNGKPLIISYSRLDQDVELQNALNVNVLSSVTTWKGFSKVSGVAPSLWTGLPSSLSGGQKVASGSDNGDVLSPASYPGSVQGTHSSNTQEAVLLTTHNHRVIVHGFAPYNLYGMDNDLDGIPDMRELYTNELKLLGF